MWGIRSELRRRRGQGITAVAALLFSTLAVSNPAAALDGEDPENSSEAPGYGLVQPDAVIPVTAELTYPDSENEAAEIAPFADSDLPVLTKAFSPSEIAVGGTSTLTFTVTRDSADTLQNFYWNDELPEGIEPLAPHYPTTDDFYSDCIVRNVEIRTGYGRSLTQWHISFWGSLPVGQDSCTVSFDVTADEAGTFTNEVEYTSDLDNQAHAVLVVREPVEPMADLWIRKEGTGAVPEQSGISWNILIGSMAGQGFVDTSAVVVDQIPAGVTVTSIPEFCRVSNPAGASLPLAGPLTVTCDFEGLEPGSESDFWIMGVLNAGFSGDLTNTATVKSPDVFDPNLDNNVYSWTTPVVAWELALDKTGPQTAEPGQSITWQVTASNLSSPWPITDAVVTDQLPAGVALTSAPGCTPTTGVGPVTVTCPVGELPEYDSRTFTITATVNQGFRGVLENAASIAAPSVGPGVLDIATWFTAVDVPPVPELALTKTGPETARVGDSITWTIVAENRGQVPATDAVVTDQLPAGVTLTSAPGCTPTTGVGPLEVTCPAPNLGGGASQTFEITAIVDADFTGRLENQATLTAASIGAEVLAESSWFTDVAGDEPEPGPEPQPEPEPTPPGPGPKPRPPYRPSWNKPRPPWRQPSLGIRPEHQAAWPAQHPVTGPWLGFLPIAVGALGAGSAIRLRSKRG